LTGEQIMLEAKIIAVADVVEAMVSHRPYRAALSTDMALEEISSNRGVLFDDEIVEICLKLFGQGFEFK
jgi:putative two-component system response regulator